MAPVRDSERIYDEFLVASAMGGDRQALDRLIARWQPRLLRHAWRVLGDAERARDALQEAWIEILRGLGRMNDVAAFPAWAYRIVSRRCYRTLASTSREPFESVEAGLSQEPKTPERESGEFSYDLGLVVSALTALPAPQRAAIALFYLEGLTVAEIAVALDVPPGTVKTRLMHARTKLRVQLEGESHGQV